VSAGPEQVVITASDGAVADCQVPFPPLPASADPLSALLEHAGRNRRVGVLLVRLGGHAVGIFDGDRLVRSKVGARHVQGRSAAGGWSQRRFARRRQAQGRVALAAAADVAADLLAPEAAALAAVVLGGDRRAVETVLDDSRLAPLRPLVSGRVLDVPDPKRAVLERTPEQFRAVRIRVVEGSE
jgi:hypothetical protein